MMATWSDAAKALQLDAIGGACDISGDDAAYIEMQTAAGNVAATLPLNDDGFDDASGTGTVVAALNVDEDVIDLDCVGHANDITKGVLKTAAAVTLATFTAGLTGDEPAPEIDMGSNRKIGAHEKWEITSGVLSL
jgi:hypothetical protein